MTDLICGVFWRRAPLLGMAARGTSSSSRTKPSARHASTSRDQGRHLQKQRPPNRTSSLTFSSYAPSNHTSTIGSSHSTKCTTHWGPPPAFHPQLEAGLPGPMAPGNSTGVQAGALVPALPRDLVACQETLRGVDEEVQKLLEKEAVRPVQRATGLYLSHLFTVPKKNGTRRP